VSGCASESKSFAPPRGSITDDRAIGDILVSSRREVTRPRTQASCGDVQAGALCGQAADVRRRMAGDGHHGAADVTLDQAVATLQAAPRVESATPDRMLKPHRAMPVGRDMPNQPAPAQSSRRAAPPPSARSHRSAVAH
jgi:hypothetical protein